jgi:hypothetical protein
MNRDEQRELVTQAMDEIRDRLLERSEYWPSNWNRVELFWLMKEALRDHSEPPEFDRRRWAAFLNAYVTKNLS